MQDFLDVKKQHSKNMIYDLDNLKIIERSKIMKIILL